MRLAAHSGKHVLIIPGLILAYLLRGVHNKSFAFSTVAGFAPAVCVAFANCVINERLDRDFDKFHPTKSRRSAVQKTSVSAEMGRGEKWRKWPV